MQPVLYFFNTYFPDKPFAVEIKIKLNRTAATMVRNLNPKRTHNMHTPLLPRRMDDKKKTRVEHQTKARLRLCWGLGIRGR